MKIRKTVSLMELAVVVVLVGLISATAVVSFSLVGSRRLKSEINMLLADIYWTRQRTVVLRQDHFILFNHRNDDYDRYAITTSDAISVSDCDVRDNYPIDSACVKPAQHLTSDMSAYPTVMRFLRISAAAAQEKPAGSIELTGADHIELGYGTKSDTLYITEDTGYVQRAAPPTQYCFVATAAYGEEFGPDCRQLRALRDFRDNYLLTNPVGCFFVDAYYELSPPLAAYIERRPWARRLARVALTPWAWLCRRLMGDDVG